MGRPYSDDLRARVAAAVLAGSTCEEAAELFDVSIASAVRWAHRLRTTGDAGARPMGGVRRAVLLNEREWLLARLAATPDVTLRGLQAELADRGVIVSHWAIWKLFASEGISFKKKHFAGRAKSA
jgi:transposase